MSLLAKEQVRRGHEVIVCYIRGGNYVERVLSPSITVYPLRAKGNSDPRIIVGLVRCFLIERPDVVQSWIPQMDVIIGLAALLFKFRWVLREPSTKSNYSSSWKSALRVYLAKKNAFVVANADGGKCYWLEHVSSGRVMVIPNAVQVAHTDERQPLCGNRVCGYVPKHQYVLYVGRLVRSKNVDAIVKAFAESPLHGWNVDLVVCGSGDDEERLRGLAQHLGINEKVHLLGRQESELITGLMRRALALAYLSEYEGFPNVPAEAAVVRCPLVLSDIAAHRALFGDEAATFVERWRDPHAVASVLAEVISGGDAIKRRVEYARKTVEKFTPEMVVQAYDDLYWRLINGGSCG